MQDIRKKYLKLFYVYSIATPQITHSGVHLDVEYHASDQVPYVTILYSQEENREETQTLKPTFTVWKNVLIAFCVLKYTNYIINGKKNL